MATKSRDTRARILDGAMRDASVHGIDGLTIGALAERTALSKSGLYAHFGSKEALQIAVIDAVAERFMIEVAAPAYAQPSGTPHLLAIMDRWIAWSDHPDRPGGCQLIAASFDFDGLDGAVRDRLAGWMMGWRSAIRQAVEETRDPVLDPDATASLAFGLYMAQHVERFLLGDPAAAKRASDAWYAAVVGTS